MSDPIEMILCCKMVYMVTVTLETTPSDHYMNGWYVWVTIWISAPKNIVCIHASEYIISINDDVQCI